jgi:hypothetical protein
MSNPNSQPGTGKTLQHYRMIIRDIHIYESRFKFMGYIMLHSDIRSFLISGKAEVHHELASVANTQT